VFLFQLLRTVNAEMFAARKDFRCVHCAFQGKSSASVAMHVRRVHTAAVSSDAAADAVNIQRSPAATAVTSDAERSDRCVTVVNISYYKILD